MSDALAIEHGDKLYKIDLADLGKYEVADDAEKQTILASRDDGSVDSGDEVEGFIDGSSAWQASGPRLGRPTSWIIK